MHKIKRTAIFTRSFILVICGIYQVVLLFVAVAMGRTGVLWEGLWLLLLIEGFLVSLTVFLCCSTPVLTLEETGVYVRFFFKTRFIPWGDIRQAGILRTFMRYGYVKDPVLLLPEGSPRRYRDKTFALRNFGKLIHLPDSDEIRVFVVRHYGPLDFDLWENPKEECVTE